jgi:lysophospholipase L1-like esterase
MPPSRNSLEDDDDSLDAFDIEEQYDPSHKSRLHRILDKITLFRLSATVAVCLVLYFSTAFFHAARRRSSAVDAARLFPNFVLFGDSITQYSFMNDGTGAELAHLYQRRLDVLNRGFSGYPSEAGRYILPDILSTTQPVLLTLAFGANDAAAPVPGKATYPHVGLDRYRANLRAMVDLVPDGTCVVMVTNPPYSTAGALRHRKPGVTLRRSEASAQAYAEACLAVADEVKRDGRERFDVVDAHAAVLDAAMRLGEGNRDAGLAALLVDGLHPTGAGYKVRVLIEERRRLTRGYR